MHPGTAGRGININVIKPRSTCSRRLHFTGKLFAVNLPLSSRYMHEASFNYLNRSWRELNLSCSEVLHQTAGDKMCSQVTRPHWDTAPNLPENTANSPSPRAAWFTAAGACTAAALWYYTLTRPFSLCLVFYKWASNNRTIPLVPCPYEYLVF